MLLEGRDINGCGFEEDDIDNDIVKVDASYTVKGIIPYDEVDSKDAARIIKDAFDEDYASLYLRQLWHFSNLVLCNAPTRLYVNFCLAGADAFVALHSRDIKRKEKALEKGIDTVSFLFPMI